MSNIPRIDNEQVSSKAKKILLSMIRKGMFDHTGKLPAEEVLAQSLGISRTVIRDVLAAIESEGFITRRRGIGTIVNKHVLKVTTRLDLEKEFLEEIADAGYVASIANVKSSVIKADQIGAQKFSLEEGASLILVERLILADGKPAILCYDHIPQKLVLDESYKPEELETPIFEFLDRYCHLTVEMDLTRIEPWLADSYLASIFKIPEGSPILHLDEVGYDIEQRPILWSKEYYAPGILEFNVLRKKI